MNFKRLLAGLLSLVLFLSINPFAFAEDIEDDDIDFSDYEIEDSSLDLSDDAANDSVVYKGTVDFPPFSMYTGEVLYTGKVVIKGGCSIRAEMDMDSKRLKTIPLYATIEILDVYADWLRIRYDGVEGYGKRLWMYARPEAVDPVNTPPYGVYRYNYVATCKEDTPIQLAPGPLTAPVQTKAGPEQNAYLVLSPGAKISIIDVYDGWGRFFYWHTYGYVDMSKLTDLIDVSPTDDGMGKDVPIAAYTSYYTLVKNDLNDGRIKNIYRANDLITRVYAPGEFFDFNKQVGPYNKRNGYFLAPVLVEGGTKEGYGGGTCQVSSTMFNVLLQLPGITVEHRRAHQQSGARYLPIGNDAAVGTGELNLQFRSNYDFPIRMEATAQDGALTMVMYRAD